MDEQKRLMAISDGTYTLTETEDPNQFYFYRNDGAVIGDIDREPMDMYQSYIIKKMMGREVKEVVMNDILFETTTCGKYIRLTISEFGSNARKRKNSEKNSYHKSGWRSFLKKIVGK